MCGLTTPLVIEGRGFFMLGCSGSDSPFKVFLLSLPLSISKIQGADGNSMNFWKFFLRTMLLLFLVCGVSFSSTVPLSWDDCVKEAGARNPDAAAANEGMKNTTPLYAGAYSPFMPQLSATGSYTDSSVGVVNTTGAGGAFVSGGGATSQSTYAA